MELSDGDPVDEAAVEDASNSCITVYGANAIVSGPISLNSISKLLVMALASSSVCGVCFFPGNGRLAKFCLYQSFFVTLSTFLDIAVF